MGSTGSGRFGDYAPVEVDRCDQVVDVELEDVATSPYIRTHGSPPSVGSRIRLRQILLNGRLVVEDASSGVVIGNLPTAYHYLVLCMAKQRRYEGDVTLSRARPVAIVEIHLEPV
jgi:hypothetical protein